MRGGVLESQPERLATEVHGPRRRHATPHHLPGRERDVAWFYRGVNNLRPKESALAPRWRVLDEADLHSCVVHRVDGVGLGLKVAVWGHLTWPDR